MTVAVEAKALQKSFRNVEALRDVSLQLEAGEAVALLGPSGGGKTTLLHVLGVLEHPTAGTVHLQGTDAWSLPEPARARLRLERVGMVYQERNLLGHLSALENVVIPGWKRSRSRRGATTRALSLLERFGLSDRVHAPAAVLSTGEAQRVAIARALINAPSVVLADEPTGSLDTASSGPVLDALQEACEEGAALLVATHDPAVAQRFGRTVRLQDGVLS